jgi:hypothetical protein
MGVGPVSRETQTVIMTDRVVTPDGLHTREWKLTDTLYTHAYPANYKSNPKPVLVVANCLQHLAPMTEVALALASQSCVEESDWVVGADAHRAKQALRADRMISNAKTELSETRNAGEIDPLVFSKMMGLLRHGLDRVQFSRNWEYALPLFSTMSMEALRRHENEMVASIFGSTNRSKDTIRKDQSLARDFMDAIMQANYTRIDSAPATNLVEISEKYLTAVLPMLLPSSRQTVHYKLENFCTVTRRGGHVTSANEESAHEKNRRSAGTPPLVALPSGFFTGT